MHTPAQMPRMVALSPPTILVTGFEPFEGATTNPSWEVARAVDGMSVGDAQVQACQLPCVFGHALTVLDGVLSRLVADQRPPVLVVALGLAGSRTEITPERVAINVDDARIPDNAGHSPIDQPVVARGPVAYFSGLPIKAMVHALRAENLPASVSNSAGTFVCNHVFYGLMHRVATQPALAGTRAGFVHVPPWHALPLTHQIKALGIVLQTALSTRQDRIESDGRID